MATRLLTWMPCPELEPLAFEKAHSDKRGTSARCDIYTTHHTLSRTSKHTIVRALPAKHHKPFQWRTQRATVRHNRIKNNEAVVSEHCEDVT